MKFAVGMAAAGALLTAGTAAADVVGFEDFDGGAFNLSSSTNVFDFGAGGGSVGDVFGRVSPFYLGGTGMPFDVADDSVADVSGGGVFATDLLGIAGQFTTAFFAIGDADGPDGPGLPFAMWTFDISSAVSITDITIDLAGMGDFEFASQDGFLIEAQIDGGGFAEIFRATSDDAGAKTYRPMDSGAAATLNDPLQLFIDGAVDSVGYLDKCIAATGAFDSYTSVGLAGASGTSLDIRVSWAGTPSGSEPQGIDNITINGVIPAPGALALLGLAGAVARRRRRA
jgi:hypothetical protein